MAREMDQSDGYDVFLSHASPDKPWVRTMAEQVRDQRLRAYLDEQRPRNPRHCVCQLGQVEKAIGYYEQALRIGQEIKDPRIIEVASQQLERLRRRPPVIP